ncbi:hypothetical protein GCM10023147_39150 [Tsukamurella soli]|uniref:BD-FAE-like domain-containing protein n=1 Tax=Tsukamurella soli TaxID=644556 RepID=A0ABP8K4R7_9ACTN
MHRARVTRLTLLAVATGVAVAACGTATDDGTGPTSPNPSQSQAHEPDEVEGDSAVPPSASGTVPIPPPIRLQYPVPGGGGDPRQNVGDLYLPTSATRPGAPADLPVVVLLHGGGWRTPATLAALSGMARSLVSHGVAVWNVEYRRIGAGGGYPVTLTDTAAAIDYLQTIKTQIAPSIDLDDVVVAGHSAGGQLAVWAAAREMLTPGAMGSVPAVKPVAIVSMAGVLDMKLAVADGNKHTREFLGDPKTNAQNYAVADPIENINPKIPVTCFNGTADHVVRAHECTSFIKALKADGGVGQAILLPNAGHNVYTPNQRYWTRVQAVILDYTDDYRAIDTTAPSAPAASTPPSAPETVPPVAIAPPAPVLAAPAGAAPGASAGGGDGQPPAGVGAPVG